MTLETDLQIPEKLKPRLEEIAIRFEEEAIKYGAETDNTKADFYRLYQKFAQKFRKGGLSGKGGLSELESLNVAFGQFLETFLIVISSKPETDPDWVLEDQIAIGVNIKNAEACANCDHYNPINEKCRMHGFKFPVYDFFVCDNFDPIDPYKGKEVIDIVTRRFVWNNGEWEIIKE